MLVATTLANVNESTITRQKFSICSKAVCMTLLKSFRNLFDAKMRKSRKARTTRIAASPCTNLPSQVSTKISKMLTMFLHAFSNRSLLLRDKSIQIVSPLSAETSCKRSLSVISKYTQISVRNVTGFKQCDEHTEKNQKSWCDVWPSQFRGFFCLASMTRAHHRSYSWTQLHGWQTGRLEKPAPVNDSILLSKKKRCSFIWFPKLSKEIIFIRLVQSIHCRNCCFSNCTGKSIDMPMADWFCALSCLHVFLPALQD